MSGVYKENKAGQKAQAERGSVQSNSITLQPNHPAGGTKRWGGFNWSFSPEKFGSSSFNLLADPCIPNFISDLAPPSNHSTM